jgi:hypothetical protein
MLSQVLVAFTIELDNEFEHRLPNRTTRGPSAPRGAPWLTSYVMWANVLRYVDADGVTIGELHARAHTRMDSLAGLQRWRYVTVDPERVVRPTAAGRRAQEVWRPLASVIEERWRDRLGDDAVAALRGSLEPLVGRIEIELPLYLPVLGYGLVSERPAGEPRAPRETSSLDLPALLSQVLLEFTLRFEGESQLSLPVYADVVRLVGENGLAVRELPRLSGVSKEAIAMAVGFLARHGFAQVDARHVTLTAKGLQAQREDADLLGTLDKGATETARLRDALQDILDRPGGEEGPLSKGLVPYPDGWRARRPYLAQTTAMIHDPAGSLPHQPMVLHRGGYPDGS